MSLRETSEIFFVGAAIDVLGEPEKGKLSTPKLRQAAKRLHGAVTMSTMISTKPSEHSLAGACLRDPLHHPI
jgi:hypothetical protein